MYSFPDLETVCYSIDTLSLKHPLIHEYLSHYQCFALNAARTVVRKLCGCCKHTEVSQIFFNFEVSTAKPVTHYINYYYNTTIKFGSKYLIEPLDIFFCPRVHHKENHQR